MPPWHHLFLDQRELFLDLGRTDQPGPVPKALPEETLRLISSIQVRRRRRARSRARRPGVVAHLLEEIDGILRRPDRQEVVAGRVAEVGGMRRRADIGRDRRLVDADDVVPSALDQVMRDGRADDAAQTDDDDLRLFRKFCHSASVSRSPEGMVTKHPAGQKLTVAPASTTISILLPASVTISTCGCASLLVMLAALAPAIIAMLVKNPRISVFISVRRKLSTAPCWNCVEPVLARYGCFIALRE
jgi:hypothetical protein